MVQDITITELNSKVSYIEAIQLTPKTSDCESVNNLMIEEENDSIFL